MPASVEITGEIERAHFMEANLMPAKKHIPYMIAIGLMLAGYLIYNVLFLDFFQLECRPIFHVLILPLVPYLIWIYSVFDFGKWKKQFSQFPPSFLLQRVSLDDDGVVLYASGESHSFGWEQLQRWYENERTIAIYSANQLSVVIPKAWFPSEELLENAGILISEKLGSPNRFPLSLR